MPQSHARSLSARMHDPADHDDALRGAELVAGDGRSLPLLGARLLAAAGGGLARVVLEQTFENPHAETLRVTYKLPLPADGAVSGYEFRVGDRTVTGRVEAKALAREQFERALVEGRTAGLLEQERADIFTQELGNIPPRTTLVARITVDLRLVWLPEGQWELRFPTVVGPRYVGSQDTAADAAAVRIAVAERIAARVQLELQVRDELVHGRVVESPSHRIEAGGEQGSYVFGMRSGERLDRDLVVRWSVAQLDVGVALAVARPAASAAHAACAYGLLTIVPPAPEAEFAAFPRDLIVLLDTSGSMGGAPLELAQRIVAAIVDSLGERDRIEVIEFASAANPWRDGPVAATREAKLDAIRWVRARRAGGATEMHTAVLGALQSLRPHAQRQVVLVTDGYIGGEQQIVDLCHERLPAGCRLHVVGVGAAVNRSLATALARAGRGAEVLVGPDEDVERPARRLLARMAAPVLTDLEISGDAVIEVAPEHAPDVFAGSPLRAAVKLAPGGGELVVRGNLAHGPWERRVEVPATRPGAGDPAIVALYAREHVADLETRWTIGREAQQIDRTIEKLGVVFQISTRHTSWIAVDDERSVDPTRGTRHEIQPQELPHGTSITSFGIAGAASGPTRANVTTQSRDSSVLFSLDRLASISLGAAPRAAPPPSSPVAASAPASTPPSSPQVSAPTASRTSRGAKTVIHTGAKKPVALDPTSAAPTTPPAREPLAPRPRAPSAPVIAASGDDLPAAGSSRRVPPGVFGSASATGERPAPPQPMQVLSPRAPGADLEPPTDDEREGFARMAPRAAVEEDVRRAAPPGPISRADLPGDVEAPAGATRRWIWFIVLLTLLVLALYLLLT